MTSTVLRFELSPVDGFDLRLVLIDVLSGDDIATRDYTGVELDCIDIDGGIDGDDILAILGDLPACDMRVACWDIILKGNAPSNAYWYCRSGAQVVEPENRTFSFARAVCSIALIELDRRQPTK